MNDISKIWGEFEKLIASTDKPETKAIIAAIKLQTELLNHRLAPLENTLGMISRQLTSK